MRYLDLSAIGAHLPNNVATLKSLIGMHSMTGCGSTSTFSGRGKRAAFELLKTPHFRNTMSLWRNSFHVSEPLHEKCEAFVCALYGKTSFLNCATACSAQGLAELANFPHVEMHCDITRCVLSPKPPSDGEPWRPSQISRTPVAMDGHSTPQVCCPFTGWTNFLHLKCCWSWFHMAAPLGVQQDDAPARPWHALH